MAVRHALRRVRRAPSAALFAVFVLVILLLIGYQAPTTLSHLPIASQLAPMSEPTKPTSTVDITRSHHSPSNRIHKLQPAKVDALRITSRNKQNLISKINNEVGARKNVSSSNTSRNATIKTNVKTKTVGPLPPGAMLTGDLYVAGHSRAHPELCRARGARLRLVVLVASAPAHAAARAAVRLTWGHAAQRADVALGFVLGAPPPRLRAALDREDALYGDLIEGRSVDTYSNLTLKTLSMLEWVVTYCPRAPRLLKTDDDMFINVDRLLQFAEAPGRRDATDTVWGKLWHGARVIRDPKSKYFVPPSQLPRRLFPDYLNGPAYLLTADAVKKIFAVSATEPFVRLEDVFITGLLANKAGVLRKHAPEFFHEKPVSRLQPCDVHLTIAIHRVEYRKQFDLWRTLLGSSSTTDCAYYSIKSNSTSQRSKHRRIKLATARQSH